MSPTWVQYGSNMDPIWVQHESNMSPTWVQHGSNMGPTWVQHGSNMGPTWVQHGSNMDPTWVQHGSNMSPTIFQQVLKNITIYCPEIPLTLQRGPEDPGNLRSDLDNHRPSAEWDKMWAARSLYYKA